MARAARGICTAEDTAFFVDSYRFLRTLQSRLRLMSITARDNLPEEPRELARLAGLLGYETAAKSCWPTASTSRPRIAADSSGCSPASTG